MKNFKVVDKDGKEHWISRSSAVAVVPILVRKSFFGLHKDYYFLYEKRGPGCPDNIGKLVFPCGYLDYDETFREGGVRELYEEIGLKVDPRELKFCGINDSKTENLQNITHRYVVMLDYEDIIKKLDSEEINTDSKSRGGESNEVEMIGIVTLGEIIDRPDNWAFNHDSLARRAFRNLKNILKGHYYWDSMSDD